MDLKTTFKPLPPVIKKYVVKQVTVRTKYCCPHCGNDIDYCKPPNPALLMPNFICQRCSHQFPPDNMRAMTERYVKPCIYNDKGREPISAPEHCEPSLRKRVKLAEARLKARNTGFFPYVDKNTRTIHTIAGEFGSVSDNKQYINMIYGKGIHE